MALLVLVVATPSVAQYPLVHTIEIRAGQQRPSIACIAQDAQGLLWVGSDMGLLRTDGEHSAVMFRSLGDAFTALCPQGPGVVATMDNGVVLQCHALGCDTLVVDMELARSPVRRIIGERNGGLWLGTYGAGVWYLHQGNVLRFGLAEGMPDLNVNDLLGLSDGTVVAATDQGLVHLGREGVIDVYSEEHGAPDNLVLSLALDGNGSVLAGTDRSGIFSWMPGSKPSLQTRHVGVWRHGAVLRLVQEKGRVWASTSNGGVVVWDRSRNGGHYSQGSKSHTEHVAKELLVDRDGAVWSCNGTEHLRRAVPEVLVVPEHEGLDLRGITALCSDGKDRIWFATSQGLFSHPAAFTENASVLGVGLELDPRTPIVSLAAAGDGTVWAASFGSGVYAVRPSGVIERYTVKDGLLNDNVLSVRTHGERVFFGTLDGVCALEQGHITKEGYPIKGFVYNMLPMPDGALLAATDGGGVNRANAEGRRESLRSKVLSYYSLVMDHRGVAWAAGPGTGFCAVAGDELECMGATLAPFSLDFYALGALGERLLAFGSAGVTAFDPVGRTWWDVTTTLGLEGMQAELNTVCNERNGALWFACNKGLYRISPHSGISALGILVVITDVIVGTSAVDPMVALSTAHDRNDITIRFSALHYADPASVRFEYRLLGYDDRIQRTGERQVSFALLPPGDYTFQVRAYTGDGVAADMEWKNWPFEVQAPWYGKPWVQVIGVLLLAIIVLLVLRMRENRVRARQRLEQERIRFQLEVLRSQVDPHFLFNSFNTLVELIESEPARAVEHVERLSTFFRRILLLRDKELIPLAEELDLLNAYIVLEQERFGMAIEITVDVPVVMHTHRVVPLTLQLLVENALKHNAASVQSPLRVLVTMDQDRLLVSNEITPRATPPRSTGFGLHSIRERYAGLTKSAMEAGEENGRFTVRIPLIDPEP